MIAGVLTLPARVRPLDTKRVHYERICGHEARHAAIARLFEFDVRDVRTDRPSPGVDGHVTFNLDHEEWTPLRLAEFAMVLIAGGIGEKGWPPRWPLNATGELHTDEKQLATAVTGLHLDEQQYEGLVDITRWLLEQPALQAAEKALTLFLPRTNLSGRMVKDLCESAFEEASEPFTPEAEAVRDQAYHDTRKALHHGNAKALRVQARRIAAEFAA